MVLHGMMCLPHRQDQLEQITKKLEGPVVVQKGARDGISDGQQTIYCEGNGSKRRAGGQVLTQCAAWHTHLRAVHHTHLHTICTGTLHTSAHAIGSDGEGWGAHDPGARGQQCILAHIVA